MRKLFFVFFLLLSSTAMAATDIVATFKYSDGNMVTIVTRDNEHVRMDTSPTSYMLLKEGSVYSVNRDDSGQWTVMDMGQLGQASQQSGLTSLFGGSQQSAKTEPEYEVTYEKTGKKEKIAGYTGVIYNVEVAEQGRMIRRDEVVLSTHSDIKKVNEAWVAMGEKMSQAMGGEMGKSLQSTNKKARQAGYGGMLRYGDEMKLDNLKKMSLKVSYYQLPADAQYIQMGGGMPDMNQMQQQYGQQQQDTARQYEEQQQQYDQQQYEQQQGTSDGVGDAVQQDAEDVGQAAHQEAKDQTVEEVKEGVKKLFDSLFD